MIRMIAACTSNGVIGVDSKIPFNYPADLKHFKNLTINSNVIMGRKTFESIGKPLPKRRNVIVSRQQFSGIETYSSVFEALNGLFDSEALPNVWLIGGASIYQEGMKYAQEIHLTITPDEELASNAVKFPWVDPTVFKLDSWKYFEDEPKLKYCIYKK